jgi:hypothetical protein
MIHYIDNLISVEECDKLVLEFYNKKKTYINSDIGEVVNPTSTYGYRGYGEFDKYLNIIKPIIVKLNNNKNVRNVNSFVREYKNGSFLKKHVDRKDIGITLSICLFSNIKTEWPLCAEYAGNEFAYTPKIGDGLLIINSDKITHWRDELVCDENESVIQLFLHWREDVIDNKPLI